MVILETVFAVNSTNVFVVIQSEKIKEKTQ